MNQRQTAPARPLWERIERIRLERGWTKVQLARATGVDRTTLDKWRNQPRSPQPPTVKQVADKLDIDPDEALRLAGITTGITSPASADEAAAAAEDATDWMEQAFQRFRDDPGEKGTVLRGLLRTWKAEEGGGGAEGSGTETG